MKQIRVQCWFNDSEEFVAKLVISKGLKCQIRKVIDPIMVITKRTQGYVLAPEEYDFFGKDEEIDKLAEYLEKSDFDVEVIRKD